MKNLVSNKLAKWCIDLRQEDLPDDVLTKAEGVILDAIACAIPGCHTAGARRVHAVAKSTFGSGDSVIWFESERVQATAAAFANSASVSMLDLDDGHRSALGHPGAAIIPAALATTDSDAKGIELLKNVVAGYEVCIRIGMSENRKSYHTGNWTGLGVAATAGLYAGITEEQLANALATTSYHGPRVADLTLSSDMGANVKESIPWSVVTGFMSKDLAAQGFTGCRDAMDITERYDPIIALTGLDDGYFPSKVGKPSHAILRTYFKRYGCCRWIHSSVEALLEIMRGKNLKHDDIESIRVETFKQAANLNNLVDPTTPESGQYSVPYCMAIAAVLGEDALSPTTSECLHHPEIVKFARKIAVIHNQSMDSAFPLNSPARVFVTTANGTFEAFVEVLWGDPDRPLSRKDLVGKFKTLARCRMSDDDVVRIISAVQGLRNGSVKPLLNALAAATCIPAE
jgi:2-methylcitrate dehydratase PrpD